MEAHTVKHPAFHHLHQASPPTNHLANHLSHNSLSTSINSSSTSQPFAFGSNQSQGSSQQGSSASKLNFESSTAFPLLLSSISSESGLSGVGGVGSSVGGAGRSNAFSNPKPGVSFSRSSTSKGSSTFGSLSTGLHNAATGNLSNHSASSQSLVQQFTSVQLGATGKHKHASATTVGPPVDQQFTLSSNISSHPLTNGIVKGAPKPKASALPNQSATFGPSTSNGRGHQQQLHLHGAKSTSEQQYLTDGGAVIGDTSALPFKKNLLTREISLNNNGTSSSRSKASPNKENNKGSTQSSGAQPPSAASATALPTAAAPVPAIALAPTSGVAAVSTTARKASSNRSPTRALGPKSTVTNNSNSSSNNESSGSDSIVNQHSHNLHNHVLVNGTASPQLPALDLSLETINFVASNPNIVLSPSSFTSKQKPKEFKFFKEKAKDKQQQKNSAAGGTNNGCKGAQQSSAKSISKSTSKAKSATTSSSSVSSTVKKVNKSSTTKADKSSGLLSKTKNNNLNSSSEVTKSRKQSASTVPTVSVLSENEATLLPNDGAAQKVVGEQLDAEEPFCERIVFFSESIIDGFAIQCFTDQESLELSLQDGVKHGLTVLHNFATSGSHTTTTFTATTATVSPSTGNSSLPHLHPTPTSSARSTITGKRDVGDQQCILIGEARPNAEGPKKHSTSVPSVSSTSTALQSFHQQQPLVSALPVRITFEKREALPLPLSTHPKGKTSKKRRPSLVSPTRRPRKQLPSKNSKTSKGKKTAATSSKTLKKPMAKNSKSKKAKPTGKAKKELPSDSDDSDDEELDEDVNEDVEDEGKNEEVNIQKASHKAKLKMKATKCTHKHPRTQTACNRCIQQQTQKKQKNAVCKKLQTTAKVGNKKVKAFQVSHKVTKGKKKPTTPKKKTASVARKSAKGPKSKKAIFSDEDSSDEDLSEDDDDDEAEEEEEEEDDDDNSDSASDEESDATQDNEEDDSEDNSDDQSDQSGCEGSKRTIADLIKCCNRREAVRKAAERAALQSVNARSKTNRSGATSATSSSTEASAVSSAATSGPPATTTSDNADVDLSSRKNSKIKKMPNKTKSPGAASITAKGKHSANNKRSQSDNSSNEDEEESSESESESEEETELLTSPRRGRNCAKNVPKAAKSAKRPKIEMSHEDELEEDEAAEGSESDVPEQPSAASKKAPKRSTARNKASNKQTKKKSSPTKKNNNKGGKGVKAKKEADSEDEEENEEEEANLTDHSDEEQPEQNLTDAEMEDEVTDKGVEKTTKKQTTGRAGQQQVKEKKATSKSTRASPSKAGSCKGKMAKGESKAGNSRKSSAAKKASKKSANNQSDDDTEQSEQEENTTAGAEGERKKDPAEQQQPKQQQSTSHGKSPSANTKNKCDKSKAKTSSAGNASSSSSSDTFSTAACPVKDVYTFELSPVEVPSASFVLSSGLENKARVEDQSKAEQSETTSTTVDPSIAVPDDTGSKDNLNTVVKGPFSPQIISGSSSSLSSSSVNRDGPAFEPLRPDSYSLYEPPYGPNVSLSSLSQLSQSIGGGAGGPILLNHQQHSSLPSTTSLANSKCSMSIKEEPREDSLQSPFRVAHPKASPLMHETPPPVIGDHHSASQHYNASFGSSVNNKATHPRRLWSNASAGSLISSSSSSSSSPVQLAFGQCPPRQPPTPATPASLASYFTPSSSLPVLSSSFYSPNSQDLIRRDLDSRILASTAADSNLLAASLGMSPSVDAVAQSSQPQPHPQQQQQQSSAQTPFNHAPTSPMIPPAPAAAVGSSLIAPCSSASFVPSGSPYSLPPHLQNNQATFTPCVPNRSTNQVQDLSAESPLRINLPVSRSQSPREKPPMTSLKKGRWGSMHITIAHNIQLALTGRSHSLPLAEANNSPITTIPLTKSTPISSHNHSSRPSSKSSVKTFEPHAVPQSVYASRVSSPVKGVATASMSSKSSQDAASTALVNSLRPASVASSTFNTNNYPPRFGTPTFGPPSMSAPPMLPALFPSPIPSPMNFSGYINDNTWARPPLPGAILPPPTTPNSTAAAIRPSVPFSFADYYNNANSASSFLSAFAAGARPPGEAFFASQSKPAAPESNNKPTTSTSSSSGSSGGGSNSHKRKHENHEHGKERAHSSRHQNGDIRSEKPSSHKKSKQTKSDSASSSASRTSAIANGERSSSELQNDFYNRKSTSHESTRHSTPNFNLAISSAASSSPYPSPFFSGSHTAYPPAQSPSASEHQRYMEMMSISTALATGLPPPPLPSSSSSTNAFLPQSNYNPASSRPLWPYGHLPPPAQPSPSSLMGSSMMSDPFKSLTDISLRPGMVSHDRETLFSRYSLLNSSGGGASIFDKMSKEQLEKFDMLQGQGKSSQPTATATSSAGSSSGSMRTSSEPAHSISSRSTPTHRLHTAPLPAALPTLPPPFPPPPVPTSTAIAPPPAPSTPFPYGYLNPLHPFGAAGANPYLPQVPPPLGHPSPLSTSSAMLNGVDPITSLALSHHHHHHPGSLPTLPPGLSADQAQFLLPPPFGVPPPGSSAANMMNSFLKGNPSSR